MLYLIIKKYLSEDLLDGIILGVVIFYQNISINFIINRLKVYIKISLFIITLYYLLLFFNCSEDNINSIINILFFSLIVYLFRNVKWNVKDFTTNIIYFLLCLLLLKLIVFGITYNIPVNVLEILLCLIYIDGDIDTCVVNIVDNNNNQNNTSNSNDGGGSGGGPQKPNVTIGDSNSHHSDEDEVDSSTSGLNNPRTSFDIEYTQNKYYTHIPPKGVPAYKSDVHYEPLPYESSYPVPGKNPLSGINPAYFANSNPSIEHNPNTSFGDNSNESGGNNADQDSSSDDNAGQESSDDADQDSSTWGNANQESSSDNADKDSSTRDNPNKKSSSRGN